MNHFRKLLSLCLALCLLTFSVAAFAEATPETTEAPVAEATATPQPIAELNADDVIATVDGEDVKWSSATDYYDQIVAEYGSYYDMADSATIDLFRSVAMAQAITMTRIRQEAKANGIGDYTQEQLDAIYAQAEAALDGAIEDYVNNNGGLTESSTDADKTAAYETATEYYKSLGYTKESMRKSAVENDLYSKVKAIVCKDVAVTDDDVENEYQSRVAADKELYENDIAAYENYNSYVVYMQQYAAYYGETSTVEPSMYKPNGYRVVKHILLPVDAELMAKYTDLQARLEEQMSAETAAEDATEATATPDPANTPEPTQEPVTQADVDNAKADILASLATKIDEINQKLANGEDFEAVSAEYSVDAEGKPTDQGMSTEAYKNSGYEVGATSISYERGFVDAAFSVNEIGDVSAPYLTKYGVHIVKYVGDAEGGPIPMTDAQRETMRSTLLTTKQTAAMQAWEGTATITYSGLIPSIAELNAAAEEDEAADTEDTTEVVDEAEAPVDPTEAPAE